MHVNDLLDIRLPVDVAGRRFFVRRLRLSDVMRILIAFDDQIRAFASQENPDALALFSSLDKDATADLFSHAVDPYDPIYLRANLTLQKSMEIALLIGNVNDLERIWSSLKIGNKSPEKESGVEPVGTPSSIPSMLRVLDMLARRYGIDPTTIPNWHFEAFLDFVELVEDESRAQREAAQEAGFILPDGSILDFDLVDDSKIKVGPMPDLNKMVN